MNRMMHGLGSGCKTQLRVHAYACRTALPVGPEGPTYIQNRSVVFRRFYHNFRRRPKSASSEDGLIWLDLGTGQEFYIDLLFYHLHLRCFVVIDLKVEEFQPEHAGKMGFYLSAVDDQFRHADDQPMIGLILCRRKSRVIVEYTLRRSTRWLGVSTYELTRALPASLQSALPTVEEIEAELAAVKPLADEETQTSPRESKGRPSNKKRRSPRSQKNP